MCAYKIKEEFYNMKANDFLKDALCRYKIIKILNCSVFIFLFIFYEYSCREKEVFFKNTFFPKNKGVKIIKTSKDSYN